MSALSDVPIVAEAVVPGFNSISWIGLLAPNGTTRDIAEKISADVREVLAEPEVKTQLVDLGALPRGNTPAQFAQIIGDRKLSLD